MNQKLFFSFATGLTVSAFLVALTLGLQEASARPDGSGIVHLVLFSVKDGVTEAEAQQLLASAEANLGKVNGVRNLRAGKLISANKSKYPYGFVMEFDDEAALQSYGGDPQHTGWVQREFRPKLGKLLVVDLKIP